MNRGHKMRIKCEAVPRFLPSQYDNTDIVGVFAKLQLNLLLFIFFF